MKPLSASNINRWQRCPRYYRHTITHDATDRRQFAFGKQFHKALEFRALKGVNYALSWLGAQEPSHERAELATLLAFYDARWAEADANYTYTGVEVAFPPGASVGPWGLVGMIDAVVTDKAGRTWLVEHKTSSGDVRPGSTYWQKLRLDIQVTLYLAAAKELGLRPAGVIYDVISRANLEPRLATPEDKRRYTKTGELYKNQRAEDETLPEYQDRVAGVVAKNIEFYFQRETVVRLEHEQRQNYDELVQIGRQIHEATERDEFPRAPGNCHRYGRLCEFFDVCTGTDTLENEKKYERKTKQRH